MSAYILAIGAGCLVGTVALITWMACELSATGKLRSWRAPTIVILLSVAVAAMVLTGASA